MPTDTAYLFDNATPEAARQVQLLAAILDLHTKDVLTRLDMEPGWAALDLGAGAGTIAQYLADACGIDHVVALDTNTQHIQPHDSIEIRQQNVRDADLGNGVYGLVHARLLFMHQPDREQLLQRVVDAVEPGGYVVVSDWDCTRLEDMLLTAGPELRQAFLSFQNALIGSGQVIGMDPGWARRIPAAMLTAGLTEVEAEVYNRFWTGGQPGMQLHASNSRQREVSLLAAGVTMRELEILRDGMEDPAVNGYSYPMYTAVGRRPR